MEQLMAFLAFLFISTVTIMTLPGPHLKNFMLLLPNMASESCKNWPWG